MHNRIAETGRPPAMNRLVAESPGTVEPLTVDTLVGELAMTVTRRTYLAGMATAGMLSIIPASPTHSQDSTPVAVDDATPAQIEGDTAGYAIARLRTLPTSELTDAIFPD